MGTKNHNQTVQCWIIMRGTYDDRSNVGVVLKESDARKMVNAYNKANGYGPNHCDRYSYEPCGLYINGWKAKHDIDLIAQREAYDLRNSDCWY